MCIMCDPCFLCNMLRQFTSFMLSTPECVPVINAFMLYPISARFTCICVVLILTTYKECIVLELIRGMFTEWFTQPYSDMKKNVDETSAKSIEHGQHRFISFLVGILFHPHSLYRAYTYSQKKTSSRSSIWYFVCVDLVTLIVLLILQIKIVAHIPHIQEEKTHYGTCLLTKRLSAHHSYSVLEHCLFGDRGHFGHVALDFLNITTCVLFITKDILVCVILHTTTFISCIIQLVHEQSSDVDTQHNRSYTTLSSSQISPLAETQTTAIIDDMNDGSDEETYEEVDLSKMKVKELRNQLKMRGLNEKGKKSELINRLAPYYKKKKM